MTAKEFNKKYEKYLEPRFYGMDIHYPEVIKYMDEEFENEIKINPDFLYSQIKLKFGMSRVYAESDKTFEWEDNINKIIKEIECKTK